MSWKVLCFSIIIPCRLGHRQMHFNHPQYKLGKQYNIPLMIYYTKQQECKGESELNYPREKPIEVCKCEHGRAFHPYDERCNHPNVELKSDCRCKRFTLSWGNGT